MPRGRKPQDPERGAMSAAERSARRMAGIRQQAQQAVNIPSEAHALPLPALMHALQGQLAQIEREPMASRHPAAALIVAIVSKYRLPLFVSLEAPIDTRLDAGVTGWQA